MTTRNLTCAELDERLGDYLEGSLDDASVADLELHLSGCPSCAALVRDFERITRDAAALPALPPAHDLWPAIAQRLDAPVTDLAAHAAAKRAHAGRAPAAAPAGRWQRARLGAMAAGLVGITAISTYYLTSRQQPSAAERVAAAMPGTSPASPASGADQPSPESTTAVPLEYAPTPVAAPGAGGRADAFPASRAERLSGRATYDAEIASLR
ncbi:MAG TPA: zf-HC2 domain-containing protein, partial [Gemmatimonadaceae bacterium]|nr:zf-HC2 domain-containing protein [Gemmatimonadaceae bacterium]